MKATIVVLVVVGMCAGNVVRAVDTQRRLEALFEKFAMWKFSEYPEYASKSGFHDFDDKLSNFSLDALKNVAVKCGHFKLDAEKFLAQSKELTDIAKHYLRLIIWESKTCLKGMLFKGYLFADVSLQGIQFSLPQLFKSKSNFRLRSIQDYERVLTRLQAIPELVEQTIVLLRLGIRKNITMARESLSLVRVQFSHLQKERPEESDFFSLFRNLENKFASWKAEDLQSRAKAIIKDQVLPSFDKLDQFIHEEYVKHLRRAPGIVNIPNGRAFYQACLEFHTSQTKVDPARIHQIGMSSIDELHSKIEETAKKLLSYRVGRSKTNQTFVDIVRSLQQREDQMFTSKEEALDYFQRIVREQINTKVGKAVEMPEKIKADILALRVEATPPGDGIAAYYKGPSRDGRRNGTVYVNLDKINSFRKFELMSLALHEGNPGHHYQTVLLRSSKLPVFNKYSFYDRLTFVPSRTPIPVAAAEGWGLYAETLGHIMGTYEDDPMHEIGHYSWALLRSVRLVADTGIHYYNWTKERAVDFLLKNTAVTRRTAEMEVDRYITWPGQAVAYKMGELAIQEVLKRRKKVLGTDKFDLRRFHSHVVLCMGPLKELERCVQIREQLDKDMVTSKDTASSARSLNFYLQLVVVSAFTTVYVSWTTISLH